ncbi:tyrosine-type recombinase/integrase, partial [Caballeronia sp. LZ003]|nr:integrase [Caballeronia sp. LZ003]
HWKPSRSPSRVNQVENYLASDIYPIMGGRPVTDIRPAVLREMLRKIQARGAPSVAKVVLQICNQVLRYAMAHDWAERNPVAELRTGDLLSLPTAKNHARVS